MKPSLSFSTPLCSGLWVTLLPVFPLLDSILNVCWCLGQSTKVQAPSISVTSGVRKPESKQLCCLSLWFHNLFMLWVHFNTGAALCLENLLRYLSLPLFPFLVILLLFLLQDSRVLGLLGSWPWCGLPDSHLLGWIVSCLWRTWHSQDKPYWITGLDRTSESSALQHAWDLPMLRLSPCSAHRGTITLSSMSSDNFILSQPFLQPHLRAIVAMDYTGLWEHICVQCISDHWAGSDRVWLVGMNHSIHAKNPSKWVYLTSWS